MTNLQLQSLLAEAQNLLDEEFDGTESKASFLKRIDISTAIDKAANLANGYEQWLEKRDDPTYHPSDTREEHRGEV